MAQSAIMFGAPLALIGIFMLIDRHHHRACRRRRVGA